jgi:hypothetical protein
MMNAIPSKLRKCLASPFLLIHGMGHDVCTWIPVFSMHNFHHEKDGDISRLKHQAHNNTMEGIDIVCSSWSNALQVYNPWNFQYYEPDSYWIDSY